jgi:hypothetical protein
MSNVHSRGYSGSSNNLAHASSLKCKNPIRLPDGMWKGESKERDKGSGSKEQGKVVERRRGQGYGGVRLRIWGIGVTDVKRLAS